MATFRDPNKRPKAIMPNLENIPVQLKRYPNWVLWEFVWKDDTQQWSKVPINAHNFQFAKSDDPSTWATFEKVSEHRERGDGIGFVFSADDPYCGIDFDNCVGLDGTIDPQVAAEIEKLDSYTELSPSGTGVHVIVTGAYGGGNKKGDKEVYDRTRYFAFTGKVLNQRAKINWRQTELERLKREFTPVPKIEPRATPQHPGKTATELLELAFASRKGDKIKGLYEGDTSEYGGDDSNADLALTSHLAFWAGGDYGLIDEMFRGSKLYREKWDKRHNAAGRTYGQMTIERALVGKTEFYSAPKKQAPGEVETPAPDVIQPPLVGVYRARDLRDEVFDLYHTGRQPGEHPGWEQLAELYTVQKQQFTIITGIPGSGKSAFLDALLVNLAQIHDWKFAICSLETQPIQMHMSMIAEIYQGQPFNDGPTPRMSENELEQALDWIEDHFVFVLPEENRRTLDGVIELVAELDVDGVVIDPWNELEHRREKNMSETEYVSHCLSKMRHHARLFNQHWWLVAHPTKLQKDKNTGKYLVPTLYDISGSAHFRNKADFGLVAWRDAEDPQGPTSIYVQKVRFRWCGKIGSCDLYFDKLTGRYSERRNVYSLPRKSALSYE
jgi:hypothetical protein